MTMTADLHQQLADERARQDALAADPAVWKANRVAEAAERDRVRTLETLATLDIGCVVWEKRASDSDIPLRGGIVISVAESVDTETGEIRRGFVTGEIHHGRELRTETIAEHEVDAALCKPPNSATVRALVRRLLTLTGQAQGVWTSRDSTYYDVAGRLIRAVLQ